MARKTGRSTKPRQRRPAKGEARDRLLDAALTLFAERGWVQVSLEDIAKAAGIDAAEAFKAYPSKAAILGEFIDRIDRLTVEQKADGASVRERLFDLLMRRLDALQPHKPAIRSLAQSLCRHPLAGLKALPRLLRSMIRILEAAGADASGLPGLVKAKGLGLIYGNALRVWLRDDSPDMARTMAALDRGLAQAEGLAKLCPAIPKPLKT
jgi:ubiquinone biosynthesis protein COQ9